MTAVFQSPVFWGGVIAVGAIAYIMGRRSTGRGAAATQPGAAGPVAQQSPSPAAPSGTPAIPQPDTKATQPSATRARFQLLCDARNWGYQLQDIDVARAAASPYDVLVIDYARDGTEETRLTAAELERLKRKPDGGRRLVIAYVSIGEAESYRPYWDANWKRNKPLWLLKENPEWEENYAVCFWDPGWQRLICGRPDSYLDRVQAQGFDGVYLDKCDVFEDLQAHAKKVAATRPDIQQDMVEFVARISRHLKSRDPEFLVIMQNAEVLLERAELMAAIDGAAKEELVYGLDGPEKKNAPDEIEFSRDLLDRAKRAGKPVFVVEYLNDRGKITDAARTIADCGYVLYTAAKDRELKRLSYDTLEA